MRHSDNDGDFFNLQAWSCLSCQFTTYYVARWENADSYRIFLPACAACKTIMMPKHGLGERETVRHLISRNKAVPDPIIERFSRESASLLFAAELADRERTRKDVSMAKVLAGMRKFLTA